MCEEQKKGLRDGSDNKPYFTLEAMTVRTRFVLVETSHAGNVGAVARAMKVMGFDDLVLVRPRWPDVLQHQEALDRASGANDVLPRRCAGSRAMRRGAPWVLAPVWALVKQPAKTRPPI